MMLLMETGKAEEVQHGSIGRTDGTFGHTTDSHRVISEQGNGPFTGID
jgi:hypothetical protein